MTFDTNGKPQLGTEQEWRQWWKDHPEDVPKPVPNPHEAEVNRLFGMKMSEWPDGLYEHVASFGNRYGICGEVIISAIEDWLRLQNRANLTQKTNINLHKIRGKRSMRNSEPAYDVTAIGTALGGGKYELEGFDDSGVEYYDALLNKSVWSIGFEHKTGRIIASLASDLYGHPDYTCIWLR